MRPTSYSGRKEKRIVVVTANYTTMVPQVLWVLYF